MTYGIYLAAYSLRTKGDSALLLALGASRRYHLISTVTELVPSIVIGILTGVVTGIVVSSLMLGSLAYSGAYTGSGERLVPPFILETDWSLPLITFAAVFVVFLVGMANTGSITIQSTTGLDFLVQSRLLNLDGVSRVIRRRHRLFECAAVDQWHFISNQQSSITGVSVPANKKQRAD